MKKDWNCDQKSAQGTKIGEEWVLHLENIPSGRYMFQIACDISDQDAGTGKTTWLCFPPEQHRAQRFRLQKAGSVKLIAKYPFTKKDLKVRYVTTREARPTADHRQAADPEKKRSLPSWAVLSLDHAEDGSASGSDAEMEAMKTQMKKFQNGLEEFKDNLSKGLSIVNDNSNVVKEMTKRHDVLSHQISCVEKGLDDILICD